MLMFIYFNFSKNANMYSTPFLNFLIIAVVMLGVIVVVEAIILPILEAEARGCRTSTAANASQGRCVH
jgi:hypothetical protein